MRITRTRRSVLVIGVLVALTLGAGTAAAANTVAIGDHNATVDESTPVVVSLDDAPDGIQRYNVTVQLENPEVARVESADAGDIESFQVRAQTDETVTFRAADLSRSVQPGATDVTLGTVTLAAAEPGTTEVSVTVHDFRTDDGEQVQPTVSGGTLTVQRENTAAGDSLGGELRRLSRELPGPPIAWAAGIALVVGVIIVGLVTWGRSRRASTPESGNL